jgi:hypothetical protein
MHLYQISAEYAEILDNLYDEEGVINNDALIKLEHNELAMEKKVIAIASFIKNLDAEKEAIAAAKKAMGERESRYKKRSDELQGYLLFNMEKRGINQVKCPYFEIKLAKCPASVDILDEKALPAEYTRVKTEVLPDKVKMKKEMLMGVIIPGAALKTNLRLEIK